MSSNQYFPRASDNFLDKYFAWLRFSLALILALPVIAGLGVGSLAQPSLRVSLLLSVLFVGWLILIGWLWRLLGRPLKYWQKVVELQSKVLEKTIFKAPERAVAVSIVLVTACSLLLELTFIRWQASLYEVFAFYKNFILLASFAGLGIGYSCSKNCSTYPLFLPLLTIFITSMVFLHYAPPELFLCIFHFLPVIEQLAMSLPTPLSMMHFLSVYVFLTAVFCMTILLFLPLGQLCGRLMDRLPNLRAYSMNLIGSLLGVLSMIVLSQMWTPPVVWFALAMGMALPFLLSNRRALFVAGIASLISLAALSVSPFGYESIYSPYQLLQRGKADVGLTIQIVAAGQYYQRILDLSPEAQADPRLKHFAFYYNLPYRFKPAPDSVLIVGAGTGNDVAAALRAGAKHVDAVEIDPAIYRFGSLFHPEQPYENPKVTTTITDARQFLRTSKSKYDLIVFGLLDSHTATSQGTQLRTDSYIYTVEAFKDVREHLKDDGIVALSFGSISPELDQKLKRMLQKAFQFEPKSIVSGYEGAITLIESKSESPNVPPSVKALEKAGYCTINSKGTTKFGEIDLSTDDWPFFYMTRKQFPMSYVMVLLLIVALTVAMLFTVQAKRVNFSLGNLVFMFLGAGFMLIETKAITELGLYFGNTWQITGFVIASILIMAFVANVVIERFKPNNVLAPAICLLLSLGIGMYLHHAGIFTAEGTGPIIAIAVLTLPVLFSGVLFSILLNKCKDISAAMSMNIFGALLGGALEYLALWGGYQVLYMVAIGIYAMALLCCIRLGSNEPPSSS